MSSSGASALEQAADLSFRVDLPLVERAVVLARHTIVDVLRGWQLTDEDWTYDVLLLGSELVANAVRHGGRRVELGLTLREADLLVEVRDGSSVVPAPREAADESGRGLAIVTAIAADWGVLEHGDGKTVWARMDGPALDVGCRTGAQATAGSSTT